MSAKAAVLLRRKLIVATISATALIAMSSCAKKAPAQQMTALPVVTAEVISKDFPVVFDTFGYLTSISDVNIQAQVTGQIMTAPFTEGQLVKTGDILFTIDKSPYQAVYDNAAGTLHYDEGMLAYNQYLMDQNKVLADTTVLARQTYEQYVYNVQSYKGKVEADKANVEKAQINLNWCEVRAPAEGITGMRLIDPGNIITSINNSTLVNIKQVDPIYGDFTVPEKYFPLVRSLMDKEPIKVLVKPQGDDKTYEGKVAMVNNTIDTSAGTLTIRSLIPNPNRALWPGQFINIKVVTSILKNATLVPVDAVQTGKNGQFLYAVRDGKAIMLNVVVGKSDVDYTPILEVKDGELKVGERVVRVGTMLIRSGAPVIEAAQASAMMKAQMEESMKKNSKLAAAVEIQKKKAAEAQKKDAEQQKKLSPEQKPSAKPQ